MHHYQYLQWITSWPGTRSGNRWCWYEHDGSLMYYIVGREQAESRHMDAMRYMDKYVRGFAGSRRYPRTNLLCLFYPQLKKAAP